MLLFEVLSKSNNGIEVLHKRSIYPKADVTYISPDTIKEEIKDIESLSHIQGINIELDRSDINLRLEGFEYVNISSLKYKYADVPKLEVFGSGTKVKMERISVDSLYLSNCSAFIIESHINEIMFTGDKGIKNIYDLNLDLLKSHLGEVKVRAACKRIHIQSCQVNELICLEEVNKIERIIIWQNSTLKKIALDGEIEKVKLINCNIEELRFNNKCRVREISTLYSYIERIHRCFYSTIGNKNMDAWMLMKQSAKYDNRPHDLAEAGYNYSRLERKTVLKGAQKSVAFIIEYTSGYGYRPMRTIITGGLIWIIFGILYWILTISGLDGIVNSSQGSLQGGWASLMYSMYFSIITLSTTGYGEIVPLGWIVRMLSGIESVLGVLIMSLFIFTLTKKYGSL